MLLKVFTRLAVVAMLRCDDVSQVTLQNVTVVRVRNLTLNLRGLPSVLVRHLMSGRW